MDFIKKKLIWIIIFLLGIFIIHNSIGFGRNYFGDFISRNGFNEPSKFNIFLSMSILKYIVIGILLSIFSGIKLIKK